MKDYVLVVLGIGVGVTGCLLAMAFIERYKEFKREINSLKQEKYLVQSQLKEQALTRNRLMNEIENINEFMKWKQNNVK